MIFYKILQNYAKEIRNRDAYTSYLNLFTDEIEKYGVLKTVRYWIFKDEMLAERANILQNYAKKISDGKVTCFFLFCQGVPPGGDVKAHIGGACGWQVKNLNQVIFDGFFGVFWNF